MADIELRKAWYNIPVPDNTRARIGTDSDVVLYLRSTTLSADAEITSVIVGTSDHQGVAANSLIISNITADGDILGLVNDGGNSLEWLLVNADVADLVLGHGMATVTIKTASGDLTLNPAGDVVVTSGKKLGIGTTSPTRELELSSASAFIRSISTAASSATGGGGLELNQDDGAAQGDTHRHGFINLGAAVDGAGTLGLGARIAAYAAALWSASERATYLALSVVNGTTETERLRITPVGTLTTLGATPANVTAAGALVAGGGIAFSDVLNAWIDDATHGTGTVVHYIGNQTIDTTASARKWKENIVPVNGGAKDHLALLSGLLQEYDYRNGEGHFVGMVAEDVREVLPQYVVGADTLSLRYQYMVGPLLWGWQEHEERIAAVEEANRILRGQLEQAGILVEA